MNRVAENNTATGGDICGAWPNLNFGNPFSTTTVNPDVLHGWGIGRTTGSSASRVQQEILPRVSIDVSYSRRSWGNHFFTDNRAIDAGGLRHRHDHRAAQSEPARRRRISGDVRHPQLALAARRDGQLLHVRQRLRRRHDLLARRRISP